MRTSWLCLLTAAANRLTIRAVIKSKEVARRCLSANEPDRLLSGNLLHSRRSARINFARRHFRPVVRGKRGVVAGGQPLSVEAGLRILQRGGNAVDAGVATILAASVIEFSHFSFGGEVPILIKLKGQKVVVIEGMGQAPMKATREFFVNRAQTKRQHRR